MVDFKWKKEDGKLTNKAKAYLKLTYKNQYSEGDFYNKKDLINKELTRSNSQKPKILTRNIKRKYDKKRIKETGIKKIPEERIRKQKALNLIGNDEPYYMFLKVSTINPNITERGLSQALALLMKKYQGKTVYLEKKNHSTTIDFNIMNEKNKVGTEKTRIGKNEDRILNDMKIHYEVKIEMNRTETGTI